MASVDIATIIAEFVEDPAATSLELPLRTSGERKDAKKSLTEFPELHCESYGFGADRQLHIFKKCTVEVLSDNTESSTAGAVALPAVNIKNTFIDDWLECTPVNKREIQSMPHGMFRKCMFMEASKDLGGSNTPTTSGDDTPADSSEAEVSTRWADAPVEDDLESMLCPLQEARSQPSLPLTVGALVVVEGLVKVPAFNGCSAVVQGWDEATERYNILLTLPGGIQQAKIKEENLRMVLRSR